MKWTSEKPTQPGWYWWRHEPKGGQIVCVYACTDGMCVDYGHGEAILVGDIDDQWVNGQWAGPITKPEEP